MNNILVTGGAGFIGSNLTRELISRGNDVYVYDNFHTGNFLNLRDLFDDSQLHWITDISSLIETEIDFVYHLGVPSSSPMYRSNKFFVSSALSGFMGILQFANSKECPVVYAATSSVYNGNQIPWREDMQIEITDYYTEARYYMERMSKLFYDMEGIQSMGLRLFSVYGPGEKYKGKYANLVTQFGEQMKRGERPVIYGDGTQTRDFVYVGDVVNAFLLTSKKDPCTGIYNIGTGVSYSLNEVVKLLNAHRQTDLEPIYVPNTIRNYIFHTLADTNLAKNELGFKATYSLYDGISKYL